MPSHEFSSSTIQAHYKSLNKLERAFFFQWCFVWRCRHGCARMSPSTREKQLSASTALNSQRCETRATAWKPALTVAGFYTMAKSVGEIPRTLGEKPDYARILAFSPSRASRIHVAKYRVRTFESSRTQLTVSLFVFFYGRFSFRQRVEKLFS